MKKLAKKKEEEEKKELKAKEAGSNPDGAAKKVTSAVKSGLKMGGNFKAKLNTLAKKKLMP